MVHKRNLLISLLAASLFATGCERKERAEQGGTTVAASTEERDPAVTEFGEAALGFVDFLERDGRFVVLYEFLEDTDGDGKVAPKLGDHGEPEGDLPAVVVEDLRTHERTQYEELLAKDPQLGFVVLRSGPDIFLVSGSGTKKLDGADPRADANPCMPARQASVSPSGRWLTFLRQDPDRAVIRDLDGDTPDREYVAVGSLWRADPTPRGWVVMREIQEDTDGDDVKNWPRQKGSCVCDWCARFAKSLGRTGGFDGDAFVSSLVAPDGTRISADDKPVPLGPNLIWSAKTQRISTLDQKPVDVGPREGCRAISVPFDSGKLLARCGKDTFVWTPESGESVPVRDDIDPLEVYPVPLGSYIGVRVAGENGAKHLGRLNLNDGLVEIGPRVLRFSPMHPSGWVLGADAAGTHAFNVATGATSSIPAKGTRMTELVFGGGDEWYVVDPEHGTTAKTDHPPTFVASNGCFVVPSKTHQPSRGPHRFRCPEKAAIPRAE